MEYGEFLKRKEIVDLPTGHAPGELNPKLFDFQRDTTKWAIRRGRSAIWADCGLGKSFMQLEWSNDVVEETGGDVLILAPLAVSRQTKQEGLKLGIDVTVCGDMEDIKPGINITNYEKLHKFDASAFSGVVLDESSILKSMSGKIRNQIIESFNRASYRLACSATPAPNDFMELGNHSEFLGVMSHKEMLSMFFVHDSANTQKWRLKGHAQGEFWKWLCSWAVMIRKPSDLGYSDDRFLLPEINYTEHIVKTKKPTKGYLFQQEAATLRERQEARRSTITDRVKMAADIVNDSDEQFLVWCDLNAESAELKKLIPGAVEIKGSDSGKHKENAMLDFQKGNIRVLVTKPQIAGFGMNWQQCHNMVFVGLSDSYERFYQAVRRCWRFGQDKPVNVHIVTADTEGAVLENIKRKDRDAERMAENMVFHMSGISSAAIKGVTVQKTEYNPAIEMQMPAWAA